MSLLKTVGGPGSLGFLLVSVAGAVAVMYLWPRARRWGRRWLVGVFSVYCILSLPWFARTIDRQLPEVPVSPLPSRIETLIVLDGDNQEGRARATGQVFAGSSPGTVWVLGSRDMLDLIVAAGVPQDRIKLNGNDRTTREQMARVKTLAGQPDADRAAIVVSRLQMPRVAAMARAAGLDIILVPSPMDAEPPVKGLRYFLPSLAALTLSRDALYELAALPYYRWRGWL